MTGPYANPWCTAEDDKGLLIKCVLLCTPPSPLFTRSFIHSVNIS